MTGSVNKLILLLFNIENNYKWRYMTLIIRWSYNTQGYFLL